MLGVHFSHAHLSLIQATRVLAIPFCLLSLEALGSAGQVIGAQCSFLTDLNGSVDCGLAFAGHMIVLLTDLFFCLRLIFLALWGYICVPGISGLQQVLDHTLTSPAPVPKAVEHKQVNSRDSLPQRAEAITFGLFSWLLGA